MNHLHILNPFLFITTQILPFQLPRNGKLLFIIESTASTRDSYIHTHTHTNQKKTLENLMHKGHLKNYMHICASIFIELGKTGGKAIGTLSRANLKMKSLCRRPRVVQSP